MTTAPPLLTPAELAIRWNVTPKTVLKLANAGQLHGIRIGDRWRFNLSDAEAYENQRANRADARTDTAS